MVNGIKVTQNAGCTEGTADKQWKTALFFDGERDFVTDQHTGCKDGGNQIPEKAFFHGWQITGESDEKAHESESQGSQQNKQDAFYIIIIFGFSHFYHTFKKIILLKQAKSPP